jgi:uncharacterized membrane protein YfcA
MFGPESIYIILGGFVAGAINSLAGFGSIITLYILMEIIGLPPSIANGTNRVNVFANAFASTTAYIQNKKLRLKKVWPLIIIVIAGTLVGAYTATKISDDNFRIIIRILIILVTVLLFLNPKRWIINESDNVDLNWWILTPVFLVLGFYAGLIQVGSGLFMLAALVLIGKREIFEANAMKVFIIFLYSFFVIYTFHISGLINWKAGILLAVSQAAGAYITSLLAPKIKNANKWAYRVLLLVVLFILVREVYMFF